MTYDAKILADSISPMGHRLTTFEITFPRIVLAEFNTHRTFCLAGDAVLEFELPAGSSKGGHRRKYATRLDAFVSKWLHGANRTGANPKRACDLEWIQPGKWYSSSEVAARLGMASATNIHTACRSGIIKAEKRDGQWWMLGGEVLSWRQSSPDHTRFDMRAKLMGMRIRQFNEDTGDIQTAHVVDAMESGRKEVFEVTAGDFQVAGSADHRVLTVEGWKTIGTLHQGDLLIARKFGKRDEDRLDPMRLKKIGGVWRSVWQREQRERLTAQDPSCRRCRIRPGEHVHHLVPVHEDPTRAFDETNITLTCEPCHHEWHTIQGWQGGTYLYGAAVRVETIEPRGVEPTYDLTIDGKYENFLANGIVVHNSRNSASSRAIPVKKMLERVRENPFVPSIWGKNQKGMQASEILDDEDEARAVFAWRAHADQAVSTARYLSGPESEGGLDVHKQIANRLLEPWLWHTVIVSATEWDNFWNLRDSKMAQPELRSTVALMRELYRDNRPDALDFGDWHLPLIDKAEAFNIDVSGGRAYITAAKISAGRCARVSYLTHDGKRDPGADVELAGSLIANGHMSPLEHPARPMTSEELELFKQREYVWDEGDYCWKQTGRYTHFLGNVQGWVQFRKMIPGEADIHTHRGLHA
jgi:hypothetical protein